MTLTLSNLEGVRARMQAALAARLGEHLGRLDWDADRLALHQRDRLRELLAHALARSPFHAERLAGVDPTRFELHDLARLPTMTKAQMMSRFDDVVTDRRLRRHLVEAHLAASSAHPALLLDEYVCLASGGSSGERGVFVQTLDVLRRLRRLDHAGRRRPGPGGGGRAPPSPCSSCSSPPPRPSTPPVSPPPPSPTAPCGCCRCPPRCRCPRSSSGSTPSSRRPCSVIRRCWPAWPASSGPVASASPPDRSPRPANS